MSSSREVRHLQKRVSSSWRCDACFCQCTSPSGWRKEMVQKSPTFQYWDTVLNMELLGLWKCWLMVFCSWPPQLCMLDSSTYESLPAPTLQEFEEHGHWVIHKTMNRIPIDQAHEQNSEVVKGSGGAVGLTENPSAFRKWMVAGPEQARLLKMTTSHKKKTRSMVVTRILCSQRAGCKSSSGHQRAWKPLPWWQWWVVGFRHTECFGWICGEHSARSVQSRKGSVCKILQGSDNWLHTIHSRAN